MNNDMRERIRAVLDTQARLPVAVATLGDADDLHAAGMTSHATINVMLALENEFDVEFPDEMLSRKVFSSVDTIAEAIGKLHSETVS